jgi:hypothetical protein
MLLLILVGLGLALAGLLGVVVERACLDRKWARCPLSEGGACACKISNSQMKQICPRGALVRERAGLPRAQAD